MEGKLLKLNDEMPARDTLAGSIPMGHTKTPVLARTKIQGFDDFGNLLFETENQIVLGGALFILEKVFGVESPLYVDYLNNIMGIATDEPIDEVYPKDTIVTLFGVGTGGCGDSIRSVKDVKFYEREIFDMIPFRVTDEELTPTEQKKYWFKKDMNGKTAYYLKKFEQDPEIKVLWKDAEGDEDGSEVESDVHDTVRTEPIETFVEMVLKISKKDIREYFELHGDIEQTRVNSIGLFTGCLRELPDGTHDFKQVKLFSKLNIPNEMLTLAKDLTLVYRIYTS